VEFMDVLEFGSDFCQVFWDFVVGFQGLWLFGGDVSFGLVCVFLASLTKWRARGNRRNQL